MRRDHPDVGKQLDLDTYCRMDHVLITPGGSTTGMVDERLAILGRERRIQVTIPYFTGPRRLLGFMAERVPLRVLKPPAELALSSAKLGLLWHERVHCDEGHRWFRKLVARSL